MDKALEAEVPLASAFTNLWGPMAGPDAPAPGKSNPVCKPRFLKDLQLMQVPFGNDPFIMARLVLFLMAAQCEPLAQFFVASNCRSSG